MKEVYFLLIASLLLFGCLKTDSPYGYATSIYDGKLEMRNVLELNYQSMSCKFAKPFNFSGYDITTPYTYKVAITSNNTNDSTSDGFNMTFLEDNQTVFINYDKYGVHPQELTLSDANCTTLNATNSLVKNPFRYIYRYQCGSYGEILSGKPAPELISNGFCNSSTEDWEQTMERGL